LLKWLRILETLGCALIKYNKNSLGHAWTLTDGIHSNQKNRRRKRSWNNQYDWREVWIIKVLNIQVKSRTLKLANWQW
jgi:hypothetical protein